MAGQVGWSPTDPLPPMTLGCPMQWLSAREPVSFAIDDEDPEPVELQPWDEEDDDG